MKKANFSHGFFYEKEYDDFLLYCDSHLSEHLNISDGPSTAGYILKVRNGSLPGNHMWAKVAAYAYDVAIYNWVDEISTDEFPEYVNPSNSRQPVGLLVTDEDTVEGGRWSSVLPDPDIIKDPLKYNATVPHELQGTLSQYAARGHTPDGKPWPPEAGAPEGVVGWVGEEYKALKDYEDSLRPKEDVVEEPRGPKRRTRGRPRLRAKFTGNRHYSSFKSSLLSTARGGISRQQKQLFSPSVNLLAIARPLHVPSSSHYNGRIIPSMRKSSMAQARSQQSEDAKKAIASGTNKPTVSTNSKQIEDRGKYRTAVIETVYSVAAALGFALFIYITRGQTSGLEFLSGYIVEESLSVDNLFVFLLLFDYFKVPLEAQKRVLQWGFLGALASRGLFIGLGSVAIQQFKPIILVFAGILIYSSGKLLLDSEDEPEDLRDNPVVKFASRWIETTDKYDGNKFFTTSPEGNKVATPLFLALVCIEISDVLFAVDSVPAVFGVTKDPLIVFTSNMFAILGLRSLYTVLSAAVQDLEYLQPAVALILGFVGIKLAAEYFGLEVGTVQSLSVIISLLGGGIGLSLYKNNLKKEDGEESN